MTTVDRLVDDYLDQLEQELRDLPRARRRELVDEIAQHIAEGRAEAVSEVDVRTLLDRLGEPAEIADEARDRFGVPPRRGKKLEIVALVMLLPGAFILPGVGWLVGVVLLWTSDIWTLRDKIIGTVIAPGGLGIAVLLLFGGAGIAACSGNEPCGVPLTTVLVWLFFLLGPFVSTGYLAWRLRRA